MSSAELVAAVDLAQALAVQAGAVLQRLVREVDARPADGPVGQLLAAFTVIGGGLAPRPWRRPTPWSPRQQRRQARKRRSPRPASSTRPLRSGTRSAAS
jgi:hypothetical protein